ARVGEGAFALMAGEGPPPSRAVGCQPHSRTMKWRQPRAPSTTGGNGPTRLDRYRLSRSLWVRGAEAHVAPVIKRADVLRQGHVDDVFDQESHEGIEVRRR